MKFIKDRTPAHPGRVTLTQVSGTTYDMTRADDPAETGTPVNRSLLDEIYGFASKTTVFNSDGSITETDPNTGVIKTTVFNSDGSITETMTDGASTKTKTTTFNSDGSISEVMI